MGIFSIFNKMDNNSKQINDFDTIVIDESGMYAGFYRYLVSKTNDGVNIEYSYINPYYNEEDSTELENKTIIRSTNKGKDVYQKICDLLVECKAYKWDGFHGTNPNVLDGDSFSFELNLNNETKINASGTNSYPKNYFVLKEYISSITLTDIVNNIDFEVNDYTISLPEKWIGNINIRYGDEYVAFFIKHEDQEKSLFIIYDVEYEYTNVSDYQYIGTLNKENDNIKYLYAKINDKKYYSYLYEKLDDVQKTILDSLNDDCDSIIESLQAKNNYKLER